jgi:hypothetical protein
MQIDAAPQTHEVQGALRQYAQVHDRVRSLRRRQRRLAGGGVVGVTAAVIAVLIATVGSADRDGHVTTASPVVSSSPPLSATNGTAAPAPQETTESAILAKFEQPGALATRVTRASVKLTTAGAFRAAAHTEEPTSAPSSTPVYVVVQAGQINQHGIATSSTGPLHWVATIIIPSQNLETITAEPNSRWPSWFASLPGTEQDYVAP